MKFQIFIGILSLLITQVISIIQDNIEIISFDKTFMKNYEKVEEKNFQIKIASENIPKYLQIKVASIHEGENPNYIMVFKKSLDEYAEREQISSGESTTLMWLTKGQLDKENNLLYVTCYTFPCNYGLHIEESDIINIDLNTQFNLYITESNQEVDIKFNSYETIDPAYITLWAIGNKNPKVTLEGEYDSQKYSKNNIFKINSDTKTNTTYLLKIKAEIGDVINIGSDVFESDFISYLINNSPEKKGFIQKDFSNQEECYEFNIDGYDQKETYYISGLIYTKIAEIYYKDKEGKIIDNTVNIITNGSFIHTITPSTENKKSICLRFPTKDTDKYNLNDIFYSIQLTDPKQSDSKINLYSSQNIGEIYPRILKEGEIYIFKGIPLSDDITEISFDMISDYGLPDMYFDICTNYPLCDNYNYDNLYKLTDPMSINSQSSYKLNLINTTIYSPMDKNQYVLIVKCVKNKKQSGLPCGFKTVYNSKNNKINLKENELFSQYIQKGETNLYKIDFTGQNKLTKIYVDLMVFTGDIIFNPIETHLNAKKLYMANKIFYIITIDQTLFNPEIDFNVTGSKNSYYSIKYMLVKENDDSWITNIIESGVSYLVTIDPEGKDSHGEKKPYKYIKFCDLKLIEKEPFIVSFNSLNCKLNASAKRFKEDGSDYYEPIDSFDQYYQDIVYKNKDNDYQYLLKIDEMDFSVYNNKLCMIYASAIEMNQGDLDTKAIVDEKPIVISDNEPKQIVFKDGITKIQYLYPHSNRDNDVIIKFNLLDIALYDINISYAFKNNIQLTQTGNEIIYLHHSEWKNLINPGDICPIIINITKSKTLEEKSPKLLISVKAVQDNTPSYIKKNQAQIDYLLGNNTQYYYTDLGKNEEGYAIVNYYRGSGRIYGKIVRKNIDKAEEGANWREMYKFPETVEESLEFNGYIKKIMIKKEETNKCDDGCYLLLTLRTSVISENYYDFREFPFNIMIHTSTPDAKKDTIPIINIPLNEYIIGNINLNEDKKINEFYTTYFTHDSDNILIDFQSTVVNFYIKVGMNNKPTLTDNDFDFDFQSDGDDTIYIINKTDFLKKCEKRKIDIPNSNSLLGLGMTIGIWTDKIDSLYTTVYSIKINLPFNETKKEDVPTEKLNIYEVKSDQKTLCKPQKIKNGNSFRCLFVVFYYGIDAINHLLLYPESQDYSPYSMHADFIYQERYEYFDYTTLMSLIPNGQSTYSTEKTGLDYIYVPHAERRDKILYVSVISEIDSIIELYTSFYTKDIQLSPNPSSPQLFMVDNKFMFEFTTEEDLLVTIKAICGQATIKWHSDEEVEYYLTENKIISLPSSLKDKSDPAKVFSNLDITLTEKDNCPGFAFYISYLLRPPEINLDGIPLGKSTQMSYRDTDLPVYVYTEIFDTDKDVHAFINIYELIGTMEQGLKNITAFELSAALVNDTVIMDAKLNKKILEGLNFEFKGVYDPMIKTGFVLITKSDIQKKNIEPKDGPSIILKISKNMDYPQMKETKFSRVTIETSIIQDNSEIPAIPGIYQYGKLSLSSNSNIYRFKSSRAEKYMRIEFASGSDKIKYIIGTSPEDKSNRDFSEYEDKEINGKQVITFDSNPSGNSYIYLIICHSEEKASTDKITNYVFKYTTSSSKGGFEEYKLDSEPGFELDKKEDGDDYVYTFTITPLPYQNVDIKYFIKITPKESYIEDEKDNSIALKESNSFIDELTDIKIEDDKIVKEYKISEIDYRYVQVIAMVNNKGNYEFVGYGSIFEKDAIWWKILLIVLAVAIVVFVLVYFLRLYYLRKRDIGRQLDQIEGTMVSRFTESSVE